MNAKVRAIYGKEMRDMLRDRRTIFAAAVVPVILYPLLTLGMAEVTSYAKARLAREEFSVAVPPGMQATVERMLTIARETPPPEKSILPPAKSETKPAATKPSTTPSGTSAQPVIDDDEDDEPLFSNDDTLKQAHFTFRELSPEAARTALASGDIRAILTLPPDFEAALKQGRVPALKLEYDRAERVSQSTASRVTALLERYQSHVVNQRLQERTLTAEVLHPFTLEAADLSPPEKLSGSIFGSILPLIFIMMLMTGALNPAIDLTAGEKERSTLETLVGAPVRPWEIVTGKFLAIGTLSLANAAINVASCALSLKGLPLPSNALQVPWSALPVTLLLLVPLACFFSALLLMICSFAATTKEAQVFCLPVLLTPMLALGITMTPGVELEGPLLVLPIVNVALLIKELFIQHGTLQHVLFVFVSTSLYAAGMVALAARAFAREEVLFSAQGSLRMFLSRRFYKPAPTPRTGDALLVAALLFPLYFYFSLYLQKAILGSDLHIEWKTLSVLVLVPQYLLFLALPLGLAKYLKVGLKTTFLWRRPPLRAVLGAVLMGASSWVLALQLAAWQSQVWPASLADKSLETAMKQLNASGWGQAFLIFLIALTPAICEEHFFRGFLQQGLGRKHKWFTLLTVGLVFGFFHFPVYRQPIVSIFGVALAYVAWQSGSIWPGMIVHFLHNSMSLISSNWIKEPPAGQPMSNMPWQLLVPGVVAFAVGLGLMKSLGERGDSHPQKKNPVPFEQ